MKTLYHGTTSAGLDALFNNKHKPSCPWNCAPESDMYFWDLQKHIDLECDGDHSQAVSICIEMAFQSAQIQALFDESELLYVIELEVDESIVEINDDWSCENMTLASCLHVDDFDSGKITRVLKCPFNRYASPFIASGLLNNRHFDKFALNETLLKMAEAIPSDCFIDELLEFDYSEDNAFTLTNA
jgi:hypothetical protein